MADDTNTSTPSAPSVSGWRPTQNGLGDEGGPMPETPPRDLGQDWRPRQNGRD